MIKKIFYTLLVVFTCFIGLNKISASSDFTNPYVSVNGNNFFNNTITISSSYDFRFDVGVFYNGGNSNVGSANNRIYGRLALCSSGSIYSPYSHTDYVNTNISCDGGFVSFVYFDLIYESSGNFTTYFMLTPLSTSSVDVKFFGLSFSYTPFDRYNSEDTLIKQNDAILSDLQALYYTTSDGLTQISYKLDDTIKELQDLKSLLSQLLNSCRDSYNLFDISKVQSRTTFIVNDDGTITLTAQYNNRSANTLKDFAPDLKVGKAYTLSFETTGTSNVVFLSVPSIYWENGKSIVMTQEILDSYIYFYGVPDGNTIIDKIQIQPGTSATTWEPYGEQICKSKVDETNDAIKESNKKLDETNKKLQESQDFMNDDDTSGSSSEAQEFFEGFTTDTYGLTSIITAPLELIGNIAGSTCSPLPLQIPFVGGAFNLPCMSTIYKKHFGSFLSVYQTITFGIVAYWVCIRIFALVKDFKNPEHDEIEVMDL